MKDWSVLELGIGPYNPRDYIDQSMSHANYLVDSDYLKFGNASILFFHN